METEIFRVKCVFWQGRINRLAAAASVAKSCFSRMIAGDAPWKLTPGWWRMTQTNLKTDCSPRRVHSYIIFSVTVERNFTELCKLKCQSSLWSVVFEQHISNTSQWCLICAAQIPTMHRNAPSLWSLWSSLLLHWPGPSSDWGLMLMSVFLHLRQLCLNLTCLISFAEFVVIITNS